MTSICNTFFFKKLAEYLNFFDKPDGNLKKQESPVPYLGGMAIYFTIFLALLFLVFFIPKMANLVIGFFWLVTPFFLIGFIDDIFNLSPKIKFLLQIFAVLFFVYSLGGFLFSAIKILVLVFLLLSVVNAFNLVDVSDGLLSAICIPIFIAIIFYTFIFQLYFLFYLSQITLGAIFGFLWFNWQPAKIYLGDAGSFLLASIASFLILSVTLHTMDLFETLFVVVVFFGVPLAEPFCLILIRSYLGIPVYQGSPHHFSIYLKKQGLTTAQVALFSGVTSAMLSSLGILVLFKIIPIFTSLIFLSCAFVVWCYLIYSQDKPITSFLHFFKNFFNYSS